MDPRIFAGKRVHLQFVAFGRRMLGAFGLTPARFDMLYVIEKNDDGCLLQRDLPDILGLARSTVSKMLALLESLGLVARTRENMPGRLKLIMLTEEGRRRLNEALTQRVCTGDVARLVAYALDGERRVDGDNVHDTMIELARYFEDRSTHRYAALLARDLNVAPPDPERQMAVHRLHGYAVPIVACDPLVFHVHRVAERARRFAAGRVIPASELDGPLWRHWLPATVPPLPPLPPPPSHPTEPE
jgi:DNA-binding MarR family transcriptional regulator